MRVLFVTLGSPLQPDRGSQLRDHALISRVGAHHQVSVLPVLEPGQLLGSEAELERRCEVLEPAFVDAHLRAVARRAGARLLRDRLPLATMPYIDRPLLDRVAQVGRTGRFDVIQLEHSFLAPVLDVLPASCRVVLSLHNVAAPQYASMARAAASRQERAILLAKTRLIARLERSRIPRFDGLIVVSEREREQLPQLGPAAPVAVVPNGVDLERLRPLEGDGEPGTLLFVGNLAYRPNVDAVLSFCRETLPLLRERVAEVRLLVVGPRPPASVRALEREAVEVPGRVEDLRPWYARARLAVAPLKAGGGTRLKVLEAMALGRPLVGTPLAVEGLQVADGREVLLSAPGAPLAARIEQALADPQLRQGLVRHGRSFVERRHGWDAATRSLLELYEQIRPSGAPSASRPPRREARRSHEPVSTSVVIPAHRDAASLPLVLDALAPQIGPGREAIVVCSDVDGDARKRLAQLSASRPWLRMLLRPERLSPGQARNLGAAETHGELLAFLDADAIPAPGWLDQLELALGPEYDGAVGAITNGTPASRIGTAEYLLGCSETFPRRPRALRHGPGANLLLRRDRFEALGGFATEVRAGEDTLLTFPLARRRRLAFAPEANVRHLNRTRMRPFLANQRLQGTAFAHLCRTTDYPHGWVCRGPAAPLAGLLRLVALSWCLTHNAPEARDALRVLPELLLGTAAWAVGCQSAGRA